MDARLSKGDASPGEVRLYPRTEPGVQSQDRYSAVWARDEDDSDGGGTLRMGIGIPPRVRGRGSDASDDDKRSVRRMRTFAPPPKRERVSDDEDEQPISRSRVFGPTSSRVRSRDRDPPEDERAAARPRPSVPEDLSVAMQSLGVASRLPTAVDIIATLAEYLNGRRGTSSEMGARASRLEGALAVIKEEVNAVRRSDAGRLDVVRALTDAVHRGD